MPQFWISGGRCTWLLTRQWGLLFLSPPEVKVGEGGMDYRTYIRELDKLDPGLPLIIEHLRSDDDYRAAAKYLRQVEQETAD